MCGICGYFGVVGDFVSQDKAVEMITTMSDTMVHRGPDGSGYWIDMNHRVALGHRRLSILDLSENGKQPMISHSERYVISFNGEIYNYSELQAELEMKGRIMRTACDTEVLLECIDVYGVETALKKAVGMFGLAVYDRDEHRLYLARDRFGEKSVYYGWNNGRFVFASELKAIKALPFLDLKIDQDSVYLFLKYQHIKSPWSIYKGIFKLQQGQYLTIDLNTGSVKNDFYYSLEDVIVKGEKNLTQASLDECVDELDSILTKVIRKQLRADVSVGLFLSSGIDSALTSAIAQKVSNGKLKTYSIGSYSEEYNEASLAKEYARILGTDHHEYYLDDEEARKLILKLPSMYDEPFAQSSAIPTYLVSKLARKDVTVAISGDGGDELFAGYDRDIHVPIKYEYMLKRDDYRRFSNLHDYMQYRIFMRRKFCDEMLDIPKAEDRKYDQFGSQTIQSLLNKALHFETVIFMESETLIKVDRASMANSLEVREPFLDPSVAEFAFTLPEEYKYFHGNTKRILKKLLGRYLPEELFDIPKKGFFIPMGKYLTSEAFRDLREWAFSEETLKKCDIFNMEIVKKIIDAEMAQEITQNTVIFSILMLEIWFKKNNII